MLPEYEISRGEFEKYGVELTEEQYEKFDRYARFLVEYNRNVNLTAITEPYGILVKHFIDSVLIAEKTVIPQGSRVIDVGTGAGFPSVPLKIMRDDLKITLLDSLAKRITFLEKLCGIIGAEAEFIHGRAEDVAKSEMYREKFDVSCARAVANLSTLSEYCIPFVREGGLFLAMKGPNEDTGIAADAVRTLGGEISDVVSYNLENESRKIVVIKKISQTPTKYPRNSGQIKKNPL